MDDKAQNISYKKVVNGVECDYYVRVFEKVPNFKNASAVTSSEYDIYKNDSELIHEYQDKNMILKVMSVDWRLRRTYMEMTLEK